jgi:hypothetical protein
MIPVFFVAGLGDMPIEELYQALLENDVDCIVDVRMLCSTDALEEALIKQNALNWRKIKYEWLKYFGNPFHDSEDAFESVESYRRYLIGMDQELEDLYYLIMKHRCCIVDDDKTIEMPHRTVLAEALKRKYKIEYADLIHSKDIILLK